MIIGVTGHSGVGKSSLSKYLSEKGFLVLDADVIVNELYKTNKKLINEVEKKFPSAFEFKVLNKKKLANLVFSNRDLLLILSEIVNPFVLKFLKDAIKKNPNKDIVIDAITLFESKANFLCDKTIAVLAEREICIERIIKRDKISKNMAIKRLKCQPKNDFYLKRVDFHIQNVKEFELVKMQVEEILNKIKRC